MGQLYPKHPIDNMPDQGCDAVGEALTVREAMTRDPGREVVKKFARRHGWAILVSVTVAPLWMMFYDTFMFPMNKQPYVKGLRMTLTVMSTWVTYQVVLGLREAMKNCCKYYICVSCDGCNPGSGVEGAVSNTQEDNVSFRGQANYNVGGGNVVLETGHESAEDNTEA